MTLSPDNQTQDRQRRRHRRLPRRRHARQYEDFRICHRLQAARLLTTYGNEDAPNFIADNTSESSPRRDRPNSKRQTKFDTELARLIREDTGDGRSIARFLVNVMVGELRSFRPHHRMAAARELLNRGFGKSAHTDPERGQPAPLRRSGEGRNPETPPPGDAQPAHTDPEPERPARTPIRHSRESGNPPGGSPLGHPGAGDPLTPHSSPLTPQRQAPPLTPHSSPLTPQRQAPPLTPHSSPLTPQRQAPPLTPHSSPLTPQRQAPPLTPHSSPLTPQRKAPPLNPGEAVGLSIDTLHHIPPQHFEHTVLDLLENMGYGHARHVGRTGDGDIDGIIDQDTLGLKRLLRAGQTLDQPGRRTRDQELLRQPRRPRSHQGHPHHTHPTSPTQPERPPRPSPSEPSTSAS